MNKSRGARGTHGTEKAIVIHNWINDDVQPKLIIIDESEYTNSNVFLCV